MKDVRLWIVVLSGAWFLAGLSAGLFVSGAERSASPLAGYADAFAEEFQLDEKHRRVLVQVLDSYATERQSIRARHEADTRDAMEPDLRVLDERVQRILREQILPPDQRARFDQLAVPLALTAVVD